VKTQTATKTVDFEVTAEALAKAMCEGDIVNFRLLFAPFSPARADSTQTFDMPKYEYLLPDPEMHDQRRFKECLAEVRRVEIKAHVLKELEANRPPQLPSELLLMLADNAVRTGKYSSAAQAYESLRVRARMQRAFLEQADAALDAGDASKAVRGYLIAAGLAYDYAAFPEPLPVVPDFQTRALMLHAEYPERLEDCLGMRETKVLLQTALIYLLLDPEAAARLDARPEEVRLAFLKELVHQRDPNWSGFLARYAEASELTRAFSARLRGRQEALTLADELEQQSTDAEDPRRIPAALLGHEIENGEWWQYLKELAYEHPAAVLFVARQAVGDLEMLIPRHAADSPIAQLLGLPQEP
jgi:hypothetical protein